MMFVSDKYILTLHSTAVLTQHFDKTIVTNQSDNQAIIEQSYDGINWVALASLAPEQTNTINITGNFVRLSTDSKVYFTNANSTFLYANNLQDNTTATASCNCEEDITLLQKTIERIMRTVHRLEKNQDLDNDGLSDYDEYEVYKTNPDNPDTDEDGVSDGIEVKAGTNPNDPNSKPIIETLADFRVVVNAESYIIEPLTSNGTVITNVDIAQITAKVGNFTEPLNTDIAVTPQWDSTYQRMTFTVSQDGNSITKYYDVLTPRTSGKPLLMVEVSSKTSSLGIEMSQLNGYANVDISASNMYRAYYGGTYLPTNLTRALPPYTISADIDGTAITLPSRGYISIEPNQVMTFYITDNRTGQTGLLHQFTQNY